MIQSIKPLKQAVKEVKQWIVSKNICKSQENGSESLNKGLTTQKIINQNKWQLIRRVFRQKIIQPDNRFIKFLKIIYKIGYIPTKQNNLKFFSSEKSISFVILQAVDISYVLPEKVAISTYQRLLLIKWQSGNGHLVFFL